MRALLVSLVLVTGCTYYLRPNQLPPATAQVAPAQRIAAWQRALGVLLDEGYVPTTLDGNACFISARMRDDVQLGQLQGTLALVMIAPDGRVRVAVSGHGEYTTEDGLANALKDEQSRITKEILDPTVVPGKPAAPGVATGSNRVPGTPAPAAPGKPVAVAAGRAAAPSTPAIKPATAIAAPAVPAAPAAPATTPAAP